MEYSNPKIPEGINTSKQHPLKDFFILSTGILGSIALCAFLLGLFAEQLAQHIPFSVEQELFSSIDIIDGEESSSEIRTYFDELGKDLTTHIDLPEDMTVSVNYIDDDTINAFATLGGYISIHRGLVDLLPNENSLAMVVAHEIAHIKHRDPIMAMGRGIVVGLFLATVAGFSTDQFTGGIISDTGTLTMLSFNRKQEQDADKAALQALFAHYGHVNGATALFDVFKNNENRLTKLSPEFLSTHPLSDNRIEAITALANKNNWPMQGETIPLPGFLVNKN